MKFTLFLLLIIMAMPLSAQTVGATDNEPVYNMAMVQQQPKFPGGTSEMYKWLGNNIKYPEEAKKEGVSGKVIVDFVITKTGKTDKVRVVRGLHPTLDQEAVRVIKAMPAWTPGKQNGQPVNVSYTLPITFRQQ
jgi:tonB family C-terminal domain